MATQALAHQIRSSSSSQHGVIPELYKNHLGVDRLQHKEAHIASANAKRSQHLRAAPAVQSARPCFYSLGDLRMYAYETSCKSEALGHAVHFEAGPSTCLKCDACLYNLDKSLAMPSCPRGNVHHIDATPLWKLDELIHPSALACVAIDCEMVWTTHGSELAHVVVLHGFTGQCLASRYVRPRGQVLDLLTPYSGISDVAQITGPDALDSTDVKYLLQTLGVHARTYIIGHGLANDLKAMRLWHKDYLIDTAILYAESSSSRLRSLKLLAKTYLWLDIQTGNHNPHEDAWTAMILMQRYKQYHNLMVLSKSALYA